METGPHGTIRDLIRLRRTEVLHWSQGQAAQAAGISKVSWRKIERGAPTSAETLAQMAYAVGASPAALDALGEHEAARAVQLRQQLLPSQPPFIAGQDEAHLWQTPGTSETERRCLIAVLRALRQTAGTNGHAPVAHATLPW